MEFVKEVLIFQIKKNFKSKKLYSEFYLGNSNSSINSAQSAVNSDQKMTLVFFIGGCTFAEISAFRYLTNETTSEFLVATTCLLNGKSLISSLNEINS